MKITDPGHSNASQPNQHTLLTTDEKNKLTEILAKYDPEKFSSEDHADLKKELKGAGLDQNRNAAKFINNTWHGDTPQETPKSFSQGSLKQKPSMVTPKIIALFEQHRSGELSDEQFKSKMDALREHIKPVGNIINTSY